MKGISLPFLASIMVLVFSMFFYSNQSFSIIKGGDFNDPSLWLCNGLAVIANGKAYLEINETIGEQANFSSVQQGIYPHGWRAKDSIKEVEVRRGIEASANTMWIKMIANRSEFDFLNETESTVNIGFMFWIQLDDNYHKPINQSVQLELNINIATYLYGWYTNHTVMPITWDTQFQGSEWWGLDNDLHYIYSYNLMVDTRVSEITVDVGKCLEKALNYWKIQKGIIKNFDIYIEALYGHGAVTIDYVEFVFEPKINSGYVIAQSGINGVIAFILIGFLVAICNRL